MQPQAEKPLDAAGDERNTFDPQKPEHTPFPEQTDKTWEPMLQSTCTFEPEAFLRVMQNLIKNPNIMSTHLFRADILYDSQNDQSIIAGPGGDDDFSDYTKHMKKELRPLYAVVPGYEWQQTYVRQLVPRNRQLDRDLVQSCHFYSKRTEGAVSNLIVYVPHVGDAEDMPWYHPKVTQVAFLHEHEPARANSDRASRGTLSVHFRRFPDYPLDQRIQRTALQLLNKIHKHARGLQAGYVKRGRHDQMVPQQRFQETYARLKAKYAKKLIQDWVEETDPSKHVFEDLGIAAFLIELWADMYDCGGETGSQGETDSSGETAARETRSSKPKFPGFVDIGCGNGLLISILAQEGYRGWGFDARKRRTWQTFPPEVRDSVKEMVLVPGVFEASDDTLDDGKQDVLQDRAFHSGIFDSVSQDGRSEPPFIVSNHADELTPWTPLLAYLNGSSFIAIPCCSHNLAGARFRAGSQKTYNDRDADKEKQKEQGSQNELRNHQAAETGSLKKPPAAKKMPSAYASLCDYVSGLANEVGFTVEKEMLRIPSTRNACILGRFTRQTNDTVSHTQAGPDMTALSLHDEDTLEDDPQAKRDHVRGILARELNMPVDIIRRDWIIRARQIAGKTGEGH